MPFLPQSLLLAHQVLPDLQACLEKAIECSHDKFQTKDHPAAEYPRETCLGCLDDCPNKTKLVDS
jgi:hypothetical protein